MREREVDNLFRKKLESHGTPVPESAWAKVEGNIQSDKVTWRFYVGIAASILLIALILFIIFLPDTKAPEMTAEETGENQNTEQPQSKDIQTLAEVDKATQTGIEEERVPQSEETEQTRQKTGSTQKKESTPTVSTPVLADNIQAANEGTPKESVNQEQAMDLTKLNAIAGVQTNPGISPVAFNANPIKLKQPTFEKEESERGINLQKVIELAKDFKNDNKGWSALREAKNDLLTFGRKKNEVKPEDIED